LTYHVKDFSLDASWSFFAMSHGKSPYDGVGGMVKRVFTQASLKRPTANQILSTEAAYEFCSNQIKNVNFFNFQGSYSTCPRLFTEKVCFS